MNLQEFRKYNPIRNNIGKLLIVNQLEKIVLTNNVLSQKMHESIQNIFQVQNNIPLQFQNLTNISYLHVNLKLTHDCNLDCPWCYEKSNRGKPSMSLEIIEQTAKVFQGTCGQWMFHGGEPTLLGIDYLKLATDIIRRYIPKVNFALQTNGTLLNDNFIRKLYEFGILWGISFDGLQNDKTRKSTKECLNIIENYFKPYPGREIIIVITNDNIENIIEEYEYGKQLGYSIKTHFAFNLGENLNSILPDLDLSIKNYLKLIDHWIHDKSGFYNHEIACYFLQMLGEKIYPHCKFEEDCSKTHIAIKSDGTIQPCQRYWPEECNLGNIFDYKNYQEFTDTMYWNTRNFDHYTLKFQNCRDCKWIDLCQGGCYNDHYLYNINREKTKSDCHTMKLDPWNCQFIKSIYEYIFKILCDIDLYKEYQKYNPSFIKLLLTFNFISPKLIEDCS